MDLAGRVDLFHGGGDQGTMAGFVRSQKIPKRYDELKKAQAERLAKREAELENARLLVTSSLALPIAGGPSPVVRLCLPEFPV
jgi:hypothetical protein